jgi:hypothetical protein
VLIKAKHGTFINQNFQSQHNKEFSVMAAPHKLRPLAAAIGLLLALPVQSASINWIGTTGFWDVSGNWNFGLPTAIDDVIINVPGIQTVTVSSGSYTVNSINVTGDETLAVTGGSLAINSTSNLVNFNQYGGTLSGPGAVNITGSASWTGGTQSGGGTTTSNGDLTISSMYQKSLDGRSLVNNGTTVLNTELYSTYYYSSNGFLALSNGAGIVNNGTWLDQTSSSYQRIQNAGGAASSFNNNGVYTKNNISSSYIDVAFNNNSTGILNVNAGALYLGNGGSSSAGSAYNIASGAKLGFTGGNYNLNGPTAVSGTGSFSVAGGTVNANDSLTTAGILDVSGGILSIAGNVNAANFSQSGGTFNTANTMNTGGFNQYGGTLSGPGAVNITGSASWTGGTQSGGGTTTSNGDLTISSMYQKSLDGRSLVNNGTTVLNTELYSTYYYSSNGFLALSNGAGIVNNGTWLDQTSSSYQRIQNAGGAASSFNNNGVYTKNNISSSYIDVAFNNNSTGILNVNAGALYLGNGGLTNQGTITVASGATVAVQTPAFENQGTLQGNGTYHTLNAATALVNSGTLAPGVGDIGALTVSGDYTQTTCVF